MSKQWVIPWCDDRAVWQAVRQCIKRAELLPDGEYGIGDAVIEAAALQSGLKTSEEVRLLDVLIDEALAALNFAHAAGVPIQHTDSGTPYYELPTTVGKSKPKPKTSKPKTIKPKTTKSRAPKVRTDDLKAAPALATYKLAPITGEDVLFARPQPEPLCEVPYGCHPLVFLERPWLFDDWLAMLFGEEVDR